MRPATLVVLALAMAVLAPQTCMTLFAGAASVLLECVPYLLIATIAARLAPFLGCGCGAGPSARSLPAALATAALFGIPVALARLIAALLVARAQSRHVHDERIDPLAEVQRLAPAALLAAAIAAFAPVLPLQATPPLLAFVAGAALGIVASPCALGGVALAAALRTSAPLAAAGLLCTAGIADIYAWRHAQRAQRARDSWAYAMLAIACALVAARGGGAFVHPRMTIPLALCALYCAYLAWLSRDASTRCVRWVAAAILAAVVIGAPAPVYRATETTLADAFAGERVDFTGVAVAQHTLVRYAITCCRADAAPVALVLDRSVTPFDGRWMRASGIIEDDDGALRLRVERIRPVAPPLDPFVYR